MTTDAMTADPTPAAGRTLQDDLLHDLRLAGPALAPRPAPVPTVPAGGAAQDADSAPAHSRPWTPGIRVLPGRSGLELTLGPLRLALSRAGG